MIGVKRACSGTATQSKGYKEAGKARSGGLKHFDRNVPFGIYSCGKWLDGMDVGRTVA